MCGGLIARVRWCRVGDIVVGGIAATIGHLRAAAFLAGFPASVPVKKVDRLCSSGLQAVADAALGISGGLYQCAIAAGVESMSTGFVVSLPLFFLFQPRLALSCPCSCSVRAPTVPNPKAEGNELLSR
jgi:acetyl-CoA acetyltransferase